MAKSVGAPQQHKQPSRKGKKAWRKNVDITEVQGGLEALREEIIQGGPISERKSDELFAVDLGGSEDIRTTFKLQKPLKADEILAKRSQVPAVDSRKRSNSRVGDGVFEPSSKKQKRDWVSKKEVQRLKQVANTTSHLDTWGGESGENIGFDLWSIQTENPAEFQQVLEYVPILKPKVAPPTTKQAPVPLTLNGKPVRAVRNPTAGISYNPSFEEWDELLTREGAKEVEAEQARLRKAQEEAERQARIAIAAKDEINGRTDDESAWEGFETEPEESEVLKKKRAERKTPAQRNKIKRRKEAERQAKHESRMADKQKQAEELIIALARVTDADDAENENVNYESESGDDTKLRRRRLGTVPLPEKSLELVLPDELQESLRQLKPEGNLLQDRFRHLLVNGKIESRKPVVQPRKKKVKTTEKWSHKDFSISV